jgi:hypothetical protein
MSRQYVCAICNEPVRMTGGGLKTAKCAKHPFRYVTVSRDTSGGQENGRDSRKAPVTVKRHTQVKVVRTRGND